VRFSQDVRLSLGKVSMSGQPTIASTCEDEWKDWVPSVMRSAQIPGDCSTFPIQANDPSGTGVVHACCGTRFPDRLSVVWWTRNHQDRDGAGEGENSAIQLSPWMDQADHRKKALVDE
jgi:hypothetical protein